MMQTHEDSDFSRRWFESLKERAEESKASGKGKITAGEDGESTLNQWKAKGVHVRQLPPDEHGILRISVGGGETPVPLNYLVFRGDHSRCVDLLRKALKALEAGGNG
jgi:hypothetical protein